MPITIITGTPGAGKTLKLLEQGLREVGVTDHSSVEAIRAGLRNAKRQLVVCGVEGLVPGLFVEMEDANDWQDFEDGALFLVDEAWKWWGKHLPSIRQDRRYLELAEHRHRGYDFIITTQGPGQLGEHLKSLCGTHLHVTRKFGTNATVCFEWPCVQESPNSLTIKQQGIESVWTHPRGLFEVYQSATMHTIKRKLPFKVLAAPVAIVVALGAMIYAASAITGIGDVAAAPAAEGEDAAVSAHSSNSSALTPENYIARFEPRVPTMPASAPLYDGRPIASYPEIYCMASGLDGADSCRCVSQQGTTWTKITHAQCLAVARGERHFDPYREPFKEPPRREREDRGDRSSDATSSTAAVIGSEPLVTGYGAFRE